MDDDTPRTTSRASRPDIAAERDFLVTVLGFESVELAQTPDGAVVHAEVRAGSHRISLHRADESATLVPPGWDGVKGGDLVVHVPDVDAHHERVQAPGAEIF